LEKYSNSLSTSEQTTPIYIIFDFDRTLSVVSSIDVNTILELFINSNHNDDEKTIIMLDVLAYFMGGSERIRFFQNFFSKITNANIKFYILTNNKSYSTEYKDAFRPQMVKIISKLIPNFIDSNLIYTSDYVQSRNKGKAFEAYLKTPLLKGGIRLTRFPPLHFRNISRKTLKKRFSKTTKTKKQNKSAKKQNKINQQTI